MLPAMGVYVGNSVDQLKQFESWIGSEVAYVSVQTGRADWDDWDNSIPWEVSLWRPVDNQIQWTIPMFADGGNLGAAARGDYNDHYLHAAQTLASAYPNQDHIIVRVGPEFNGDWMPWAARGHEQEFIESYRNFVDAFRSVSGKFVFEWNVNVGDFGMDPAAAYPGDGYVDIIGMDFYYDQFSSKNPEQAWDFMVKRPYGLQWLEDFAAAHGKPTAYSEWGVQYDDAGTYVAKAAQWFASHNVLYQIYWNSNVAFPGKLSDYQYPDTAAAFLKAFGPSLESGNHLPSAENDGLIGASGNDTMISGPGPDALSGGAGIDVASYATSPAGIVVNLATNINSGGHAKGDTLVNIENLIGTAFADNMAGDERANVLTGGGGNDYLAGGRGNDTLHGGDGNDILDGQGGADTMAGGAGDDTFYIDDVSDRVREFANEGTDLVRSGLSYTLPANVENLELIWGSWISGTGNALDNRIIGNRGDNVLRGLGGNDVINGAAGNDTLFGGNGNDKLQGGAGADTLYGGAGKDTFVYGSLSDSPVSHPDRIMDLTRIDKIDLSMIDADATKPGNQAFTLVAQLTGHAGEAALSYNAKTGYTILNLAVHDGGSVDMSLLILGHAHNSQAWHW